jgi:hypothetical protein
MLESTPPDDADAESVNPGCNQENDPFPRVVSLNEIKAACTGLEAKAPETTVRPKLNINARLSLFIFTFIL